MQRSKNQYDRTTEVLRHQNLLNDFITYVSLNRTSETCDLYKGKLTVLIRALNHLAPEAWTKTAFETFIANGKAGRLDGQIKKWSIRSVQMHLTAAKLFGEYLRSHDVLCPEFWTSVKKPRSHTKEAGFYTLDEAKTLLEVAEAEDHPHYFRIALGFGAGMRRSEQTRARWEDCDFEGKTLVVHRNKVGLSHRIPMSPFLHDALVKFRKEEGRIVTSGLSNATRDLKVLCAEAKIPYRSLHALRHGFATVLIARGTPLPVVAKMGGWSGLKVLTRYAHVMEGAMMDAARLLA